MTAPRVGAILAHDLPRGAVNLQQVVNVTGYGVTMRAVDGVTELHPITQHTPPWPTSSPAGAPPPRRR